MIKKEWKRLTICLSKEEYSLIRKNAGTIGISMSEYIRKLLLSKFKEKKAG